MPRLKSITQTATKKKPKKRALSIATLKLGGEPELVNPTNSEIGKALSWYNACITDRTQHRTWLLEYIDRNNLPDRFRKAVSDNARSLVQTHGYLARIIMTGVDVPQRYSAQLYAFLEEFSSKQHDDVEFDEAGNPIIAEPVRVSKVRTTSIAPLVEFVESQIEAVMAGAKPESVYTKLQALGCNASSANQLRSVFRFTINEFTELGSFECDDELLEGYSFLRRPTHKQLSNFVKQLDSDLAAFIKVTKATRKPRKKKPVKVEKLIARVRYQKQDSTYKIASVGPEKIIGASWLWTFNTKYRVLAWYEAEEGGFSIKGTTVTNFKASGQKKLRKPEQQLSGFTTGAVKTLPKNFAAIKTTEIAAPGRLNSDTIILRVF